MEGEPGASYGSEKLPCLCPALSSEQGQTTAMAACTPYAEAGVEAEGVREEWNRLWTPESQHVLFKMWFGLPGSPGELSSQLVLALLPSPPASPGTVAGSAGRSSSSNPQESPGWEECPWPSTAASSGQRPERRLTGLE